VSGYTPVFSTVFDGTLHGRWPHTGIWVCLLAMADRHGCIDKAPRAIASDIGCEVAVLLECIADFCAADPDSRTAESDGRRMELIDPARPWGWRLVNHGKYREKARKAASDSERVASGREAERKRKERESRDVPRCPAESRSVPPSDSDTDSNIDKGTKVPVRASRRCPPDFEPDREYALRELPDLDVEREVQKFKDWEFKTARKDWPACWRTWVGNARDRGTYAKAKKTHGGVVIQWQ